MHGLSLIPASRDLGPPSQQWRASEIQRQLVVEVGIQVQVGGDSSQLEQNLKMLRKANPLLLPLQDQIQLNSI